MVTNWFSNTRFSIYDIVTREKCPAGRRYKGGDVRIYGIRLRYRVKYWGNGPDMRDNPMLRTRGVPRMPFLQGLDWIDFNDSLNDMLDHHGIIADVCSARCVLRKKDRRRIDYLGKWTSEQQDGGYVIWEQLPSDHNFHHGPSLPLLPFSTCNRDPSGAYRMLV
jgi:hypothetical protein